MNNIKLLNKEIKITQRDLNLLRALETNLKKDDRYVMSEENIIRELEVVGNEALKCIELSKEYSKELKLGRLNRREVENLYKRIRQVYLNLNGLMDNFLRAYVETKIQHHKIAKELKNLKDDLEKNSKDIYEFLSKEPISHYIQ